LLLIFLAVLCLYCTLSVINNEYSLILAVAMTTRHLKFGLCSNHEWIVDGTHEISNFKIILSALP
jgi:hypothetical protein